MRAEDVVYEYDWLPNDGSTVEIPNEPERQEEVKSDGAIIRKETANQKPYATL
jgi:hypothetical protein